MPDVKVAIQGWNWVRIRNPQFLGLQPCVDQVFWRVIFGTLREKVFNARENCTQEFLPLEDLTWRSRTAYVPNTISGAKQIWVTECSGPNKKNVPTQQFH